MRAVQQSSLLLVIAQRRIQDFDLGKRKEKHSKIFKRKSSRKCFQLTNKEKVF